jgi:oxygen-independent coproporphyrinogen-3 oxidase
LSTVPLPFGNSTKINGWTLFSPPTAAYVHIPFCRRRCYYCDFPISVVGDRPPIRSRANQGDGFGAIADYVEILYQEIRLTVSLGTPLQTVFFGGGTPSLLLVHQLEGILQALQQQFGIAAGAEISMEIDPGTFDLAQLQGYKAAGVNRVSLGVQAFQPELLTACGRSHTIADIDRAVEAIHRAGIENYSMDLISGLPGQTVAQWQESLERAIALTSTHLSCYDLTIEPGTPFSRQYKPGVHPLPDDETTAEMYRLAQRTLTAAGYQHYEISNYARPGYQCRHNRVYWENRPFYGFGMGSTSYVGGDRFARPRKTREYSTWVEEMGRRGDEETERREQGNAENSKLDSTPPPPHPLTTPPLPAELLLDTLLVGLRLAEGLRIELLIEKFGEETVQQVWRCLQPFYRQGWVQLVVEQVQDRAVEKCQDSHYQDSWSLKALGDRNSLPRTGSIRLSDPEGFLFSNVILVALFEEFESC